jgi:archaellum component FlaF (FlaF/FlaG flagellin family)
MGVLLDVDSSFSSVALNVTGCASDVEGPSSSTIFFEPLIINSKLKNSLSLPRESLVYIWDYHELIELE